MINAIHSELLKIRTLKGGWATGVGMVLVTLVALLLWFVVTNGQPRYTLAREARSLIEDVFTAGQYFGLLLTMIFGVTMVTSENTHQTATATFLATPKRGRVMLAKIAAGLITAFAFFLISTVIAVGFGLLLLKTVGVPLSGVSTGIGAVCLNGIAYLVWIVFGIGLGTLIRNQVAAVVVAIVLYLGELGSIIVFGQLAARFGNDRIEEGQFFLPGGASRAMTSIVQSDGLPPWWLAALVLLGYGVVTSIVGTLITRTRDIT